MDPFSPREHFLLWDFVGKAEKFVMVVSYLLMLAAFIALPVFFAYCMWGVYEFMQTIEVVPYSG